MIHKILRGVACYVAVFVTILFVSGCLGWLTPVVPVLDTAACIVAKAEAKESIPQIAVDCWTDELAVLMAIAANPKLTNTPAGLEAKARLAARDAGADASDAH